MAQTKAQLVDISTTGISAGSASTPGITFTGDLNTGIYSPGADQVAISTNGTGRLFVNSSGSVGIGTSSPGAKLDIASLGGASSVPAAIFRGDAGTGNSGGLALYNSSVDVNERNWYIVSNSTVYGDFVIKQGTSQGSDPTSGTNRFYINPSGNVGIGTTSPSEKLHVAGNLYVAGGDIYIDTAKMISTSNTNPLRFGIGASEKAQIDGSGRLLVGTSSGSYKFQINALGSGGFAFDDTNGVISNTFGTGGGIALRAQVSSSSGGGEVFLGGSTRGDANKNRVVCTPGSNGVYLAENATSWTASSDERKKTDLIPIDDALGKVGTLRAVTGRYLTDAEGTSRSFLIAQDVQAVLPEAVDTSDPDSLGVSYTDVIPLLVAALKESKEHIEQLEAEMAAVKAQLS